MRLAPIHLVLGATALCGLALFSARLEAEAGPDDTGEPRDTSDACGETIRETLRVKVVKGESLLDKVGLALDDFDHEAIDLSIEIAEGWTPHAADRVVSCYPIPPEMSVTVRVIGRDLGVTDDTLGDPENVNLMGLRLMQGPDACDRGTVILQDVNLLGACTNFNTGDTARLVVNDAWPVTLIDVDLNGLASSSGAAAKYGLFATAGEITANDLQVSEFSSGFGVKLASDAVDFTQTDGAYKGNFWGGLGSFGATVTLNNVSFADNTLVNRATGYDWDNQGGAIYAEGGTLTLTDVSFQRDYAPESGGSIALQSVSSFTGCGLSFIGSAAGSYGGAISAHHSYVTLNGPDKGCAPNLFSGVSAPTGAAMSLSQDQDDDGTLINATLSWLELSQIIGDTAISSSLSGPLTLTDVSTPRGLGAAGLLHTDGDSNPKIGAITAARLDVRGDGGAVPDGGSLISVQKTSLTLTESTFCGLVAGADPASMISITEPIGDSLLQRNTIWGGWSELEGSALVSAQWGNTRTKNTYTLKLIDNTLLGGGAERGVTTDESVRYWGVNNLLNNLAVGQSLGGEVVRLSHNLYGVSVLDPLDMNGEEVAVHELVGVRPELFTQPARGCDHLPLLRPTSPAIGAGPGADDPELGGLNEKLSHADAKYNSLDDIGAQPAGRAGRDQDDDGFAGVADCDDRDAEVNPGAEELPGNGLDDDCDPSTSDTVPEEDPSDPDGDNVLITYSGGRADCATAPPTPLGLVGVALVLALTRRRDSSISPL